MVQSSKSANVKQVDTKVRGNGNTELPRKNSRCRRLFITFWELTQNILTYIKSAERYVYSKEICPETKREHYHVYLEFKSARSFMALKNVFGNCDIQKAKGKDKQAFDYVVKDGEYETNMPYKRKKPLKLISKLRDWQLEVVKIIEGEPDDRKVYWYYNPEGKVGKTHLCKYLIMKHNALIIGGKKSDICNGLHNYNEKYDDYPEVVVMNLARNEIPSYRGLEAVKDGLVVNTKYEAKGHVFNSPHLFVFSNEEPDRSMLTEDRWVVKKL